MENLESVIKKFVYTGVGFVSLSAEKFKNTVEDLIKDDKISEKEGQKIIDDFFKDSRAKRKEYSGRTKDLVKKVTERLKFVKSEDYEALSKRLTELEKAVAEKYGKKPE